MRLRAMIDASAARGAGASPFRVSASTHKESADTNPLRARTNLLEATERAGTRRLMVLPALRAGMSTPLAPAVLEFLVDQLPDTRCVRTHAVAGPR